MSYNNNPYYNPEKWGLTTIAEFDESDGFYQFDYVVVWKGNDGTLYLANDSGCSCPSPFENVESIAELTRINPDNIGGDIRSAIGEWDKWRGRSRADWEREVNDFILKVVNG